MTNKRFLKAYARYDGNGRIIPGSNIFRKTKPVLGNWVEILAYECCNPTTSSTTTLNPNDCYTYTFVSVRGVATLVYTDCYGQTQEASYDTPQEITFCSNGDISYTGSSASITYVGLCTTTTTTTDPNATTTTTTTGIPYECDTLGDATNFVVLGASGIDNTGSSVINGDLGLSPGTSFVGFPPGLTNGTEYITDSTAAAAKISAQAAYTCLSTLSSPTRLAADIGGTIVTPGVYDFSASVTITGILTLNGENDADATFVFIIPSTLTTITSSSVSLINDAAAGNVYWLVGTSATIGGATTMVGNIIADQSITMNTSATLDGRAFALVGAVVLDTNRITGQNCSSNPCNTTTTTTTIG